MIFTQVSKEKEALLRVNLSGERGACAIYKGQLWALKMRKPKPETLEIIQEMYDQEEQHTKMFESLGKESSIRPSSLDPLWAVAGWTLGAVTALASDEIAFACTYAVEEVIDAHYQAQKKDLDPVEEKELLNVLEKCQKDEQLHKDLAAKQGAQSAPTWILKSIEAITKTAIFCSKRW